ncbi:inositol monophosphatase [Tropicimonas sp. IMCC6043]|uniref:inositol monophosphatase family protein n=1 Tax=Tropicimonas sp. IMCC6043 TaxID=2510645 RepID=UPI00101CE379|nr:inositol monophosphatase [Tropicimonas sp. IMCC6043]RYH09322.1 inositol monophosphatase [Tropicimonas sp. IMCC6043]
MIPTQEQEAALIEAVRKAAREEILPRFRNLGPEGADAKAHAEDLVTEADRRAELSITAAIGDILPGAAVVGEEAVAEDATVLERIGASETCVIIDPVDGTWNFAKGLSTFGVLLAVTHRAETVFGLLYDPLNDDWVMARKGGGAWFCTADGRRERLDVTRGDPISGFASPWLLPEEKRVRFFEGLMPYNRVRDLGCACHDYRMLCMGNGRFGFAIKLNPWDHAAGVLALQEAGGEVGMLDGRAYSPTFTSGYMISARDAETLAELRARFVWLLE